MAAKTAQLTVILLLALHQCSSQESSSLQTSSGPIRCDATKPICPSEDSYCDGTKCVCNSGIGNGHFVCHNEVHEYCHIINDPIAQTFGHESFDLPLPCRYFVTHVSADLAYNNWFISQCQTQVYAVNGRSKGKFFVSGFDVIVEYASMFVGSLKQLHFKANGRVTSSGYEFELAIKEGIADIPPFTTDFDLDDYNYLGELIFEVEESTKRVHLKIENCGIEVYFRPANGSLGMFQHLMPGLSVAYDKARFAKGLRWLSEDTTICLLPNLSKCSTGKVAETAKLKPSEAFLWRALYAGTPQTVHFPGETEVCERVSQHVKTCTDAELHQEAMEMCTFILAKPLFANCMSSHHDEYDSSVALMHLFETCIMSFCHMDTAKCLEVHDRIAQAGCEVYTYNAFLSHSCQFLQRR